MRLLSINNKPGVFGGPKTFDNRRIVLNDLRLSKAPVFIDEVPAFPALKLFFNSKTRKWLRHDAFPKVAAEIDRSYQLAAEIDGTRVYVLKERFGKITIRKGVENGEPVQAAMEPFEY